MKKILFSNNSSWSIYNFRLNLLKKLAEQDFEIHILSTPGPYLKILEDNGFTIHEIDFENSSKGFYENISLILSYLKYYRKIKPDLVLHNAIKPNIYGGIACGILKIPVINNISGLGSIFMGNIFLKYFAMFLYKISHFSINKVFFQNKDDALFFTSNRIVNKNKTEVLPGSGIDIKKFNITNRNFKNSDYVNFCFIGRLIKDKGIYEYVEAAKIISKKYNNVKFFIMGDIYLDNPSSIKQDLLNEWIDDNIIIKLKKTNNVETKIGMFDCIVMPSYREGMSRVLLEACGTGIPVIGSNVPGCKDIIDHNKNGFISDVKDSLDLSKQYEKVINLSYDEKIKMGNYGRSKILKQFDEKIVINSYLKNINKILN